MKTYIFYRHGDETKEVIGSTLAVDRLEAVERLSEIKRLSIGEFTKLFEVEEKRG